MLRLLKQGEVVGALVIEVKYEAGKSGEDDSEDEDQLGKYAAALGEHFPGVASKLVIYLTADSHPPIEELADSWKAITEKAMLDAGEVLRWISWRDVDRVLEDTAKGHDACAIEWRRIDKVRRLLDQAGLACFDGWSVDQGIPDLPLPPAEAPAWPETLGAGWSTDRAPPPLPPPPGLAGKGGASWHGWIT
ncbi:MAG: hypothetical protein ACREI8_14560 [Myxococcota bacterium]